MKSFRFFFCLIIFTPSLISAQKVASVWPVGKGKQFNFQSGSFKYSDVKSNPRVFATICDNDGNLVLSTDGDTVWNENNEVLINGNRLVDGNHIIHEFSTPVFVPYPKKEGFYFLIYSYQQYSYEYGDTAIINHLVYAEIDINANGGQGEVTKKQILILTDFRNIPTIAGFCDNSYYWLAIDYNIPYLENDNTEKSVLLFYKIDEKGISTTPIVNTYFRFGSFINLHFSPNGDKLHISHYANDTSPFSEQGVMADFNFLTGELYNYRKLESVLYAGAEFSPNSRFIYFITASINNTGSKIIQYDARYINNISKTRSEIVDFQASDITWTGSIKLAPDGKIYFAYFDNFDGEMKLARINKPNNEGINCNVEFNVATLGFYPLFPEFVTSFSRDKLLDSFDEIDADAGPDMQLCPLSEIEIGKYNPTNLYQWYPDQYLDNPFISNPSFSASAQGNLSKTFTQTLRASDGNCWINFDLADVTVLPKPNKANIVGSWSLCPVVGEVDYWTRENFNSLQWFVNGGEIVTDNFLDTIKISWWDIDPKAAAKVIATNEFGCVSDTAVFPVRINAELIPQIPEGPEYLCMAEAKAATYQIINTNGSVYNWIAEGGEVISGQGTNKVIVTWKKDGQNKIYLNENSVTTDAVCYGVSEPLEVEILNDSIEIELTYVSFNLQNSLEVHYESVKLDVHKHKLIQQSEKVNSGKVDEYHPLTSGLNGYHIYHTKPEETGSEIINVKAINRCNETFYSNEQQSIVLRGEVLPDEQSISLNWNLNRFWETDHLKHEIWYLKDGDNNWQLVATVDNQTVYNYNYLNISLFHSFRIKEINLDKNFESWSNTVEVKVTDNLLIPDVFTPNDDGYNDIWEIWNIDSFHFRSLTIYDKTGSAVFICKNGFRPWDGKINGTVYQGTYFYTITFEGSTRYGQITVLQ